MALIQDVKIVLPFEVCFFLFFYFLNTDIPYKSTDQQYCVYSPIPHSTGLYSASITDRHIAQALVMQLFCIFFNSSFFY